MYSIESYDLLFDDGIPWPNNFGHDHLFFLLKINNENQHIKN